MKIKAVTKRCINKLMMCINKMCINDIYFKSLRKIINAFLSVMLKHSLLLTRVSDFVIMCFRDLAEKKKTLNTYSLTL